LTLIIYKEASVEILAFSGNHRRFDCDNILPLEQMYMAEKEHIQLNAEYLVGI
jgi:hypothetical protein